MKKTLIAMIMVAFAIAVVASAEAVTNQTTTTTLGGTVGTIFTVGFKTPGGTSGLRSSTSITFKTVDGTNPSGWYYNAAAGTDANGVPNDSKSDVGILCISNAHSVGHPYYLKIKKATDTMDTRLGYSIGGAFDANAQVQTAADGTVAYPTGFKGSTGTGVNGWGAITSTDTTVYTSGTAIYIPAGVLIPISFVFVPTGLAAGAVSTTVTYTMYAPV